MTLKEFREATKDVDENVILMIDAVENPVWYLVEKPRRFTDGKPSLYLMDKSGMDLHAEIDAALENLSMSEAISYLFKNGVTLEELKDFSEELFERAKAYMK